MAKVGKRYKECDICDGEEKLVQHRDPSYYSNCGKCTQGKHREAPKGMIIIDEESSQ